VISGFRRDVGDICAVLGYHAALSGSSIPTFRDNLFVPSSRPRSPRRKPLLGVLEPWRCADTSVKNYHSALRNIPEQRWVHLHHGRSLKLHIYFEKLKGSTAKSEIFPIWWRMSSQWSHEDICYHISPIKRSRLENTDGAEVYLSTGICTGLIQRCWR
jgi:hypothetical protein